jgi:glycosyltransferase involved in cell wall biosynthesis
MDPSALTSDAEASVKAATPDLATTAATTADRLSESMRRDFAVIVPAFDEADVIGETIGALRDAFERYGLSGEVVVIDDGSSDGTAEAAERAGKGWEGFTVVRHRMNLGKTEAMVTGSTATDRTHLILFDADLQHLPDEIPRFLSKLEEGWDIVTARKVGAYDKRAVSSVYNGLSRRIFKVPVSDLNSMKAFRREVLDAVHLRHDWHRFFVVLAHARGFSVTEIDAELYPRRAGASKYAGPFRILVGLLDLISVWFLLLFSRKPLLLFGSLGLALILGGIVVGGVAFYLRFALEQGFRPLLYLVMLLETLGFLLVGVGLLAEMVAQVREELDILRRRVHR